MELKAAQRNYSQELFSAHRSDMATMLARLTTSVGAGATLRALQILTEDNKDHAASLTLLRKLEVIGARTEDGEVLLASARAANAALRRASWGSETGMKVDNADEALSYILHLVSVNKIDSIFHFADAVEKMDIDVEYLGRAARIGGAAALDNAMPALEKLYSEGLVNRREGGKARYTELEKGMLTGVINIASSTESSLAAVTVVIALSKVRDARLRPDSILALVTMLEKIGAATNSAGAVIASANLLSALSSNSNTSYKALGALRRIAEKFEDADLVVSVAHAIQADFLSHSSERADRSRDVCNEFNAMTKARAKQDVAIYAKDLSAGAHGRSRELLKQARK